MTPHDDQQARTLQPAGARALFSARIVPFVAGAAGIMLLFLAYYARTWRSLTAAVAVCPTQFCDFVDYYYPMGQAIFRTGLPVEGFLYSPFIAILLAVFCSLGLKAALVLWGLLQVLFFYVYVLLFRRLVPAGLSIQLLFIALTVSSYPPLLNLMGGSVSIFMTVAILGVLVANERGHLATAAGLLAFAVSFKFYPIIFLAPFVARRDIRFLLFAAAACGALLFVLPGVLLGPGDTLRFYGALLDSFRESDWVVTNVHSQYFPHVVLRLAGAMGYDANAHIPLLRWIASGVAAANMGLLLLVQRARLRHANLWSFQLLFLTIPFVLKTSWPHDFVFLSFSQALLGWWLLEGKGAAPGIDTVRNRLDAGVSRQRTAGLRVAVVLLLLLSSIVISNIIFFNLVSDFSGYGFLAFPFWADLLLLTASYLVLLPTVVRQLSGKDMENGRNALMNRPGVAGHSVS
jgi:hypothetical protein